MIRTSAGAEVEPVEISLPESSAWMGERVILVVKLRAPGSFSGAARFDLPELPRTLLLKTGNPVVGSERLEGRDWLVQTHQFSLFSQQAGKLVVPPFTVRFEAREGFTGPTTERVVETEPFEVEIRRPPGSEGIPFLVSSDNLTVSQSWDPASLPEKIEVGQVIRRIITQKSDGLTGMALLPATTAAPEGVRVYEPSVETRDNTERGAFTGERIETLTYLVQEAGTLSLPDLTFAWWNPREEQLVSKTLPGQVLEVSPPAGALPAANEEATTQHRIGWTLLVLVLALGWWHRARLHRIGLRILRCLRPQERVVARALKRACLRNDASAAQEAWERWQQISGLDLVPDEPLRNAILEMQRCLFGPEEHDAEFGPALWSSFKENRERARRAQIKPGRCSLPPLNAESLTDNPPTLS